MSWVIYILLATFFFSLCVIVDKTIHTNKIKSVYTYAIILNIIYLFFIVGTTYVQRGTFIWGMGALYSAIAGCFWFVMWLFFWKALKGGEASRVSAVFFTQPIYAALFGVFFLHESLNINKWVGIVVIVCGAIMSSLGGESHKKEVKTAYIFALLAAVFSAGGNIIGKYAMASTPPLTVNCIAFYSTIPLYLLLLLDKNVLPEVNAALKDIKLITQFSVRAILGYTGIVFNMIAMGLGPISLVSAVGGSQPIMILAISLIASQLFPKHIHEELGRKTILPKLSALILTVAGVAMVSM
jgi:uncharacterized membrane protein